MELLEAKTTVISNFEVYNLLTELRRSDQNRKQSSPFATITYETIKYLEGTAAVVQDNNIVAQFLKAVHGLQLNLTREELVMLLNHRPTTDVELGLIIAPLVTDQERLTEQQGQQLLQLIQSYLPAKPEQQQ